MPRTSGKCLSASFSASVSAPKSLTDSVSSEWQNCTPSTYPSGSICKRITLRDPILLLLLRTKNHEKPSANCMKGWALLKCTMKPPPPAQPLGDSPASLGRTPNFTHCKQPPNCVFQIESSHKSWRINSCQLNLLDPLAFYPISHFKQPLNHSTHTPLPSRH